MLRRFSLRVRLSALVALGATTVTTVAALALYTALNGAVSDAITTELRVRMADLASDVRAPDPGAVTQRPVIAQVIDRDGTVLTPNGASPILTTDELAAATERDSLTERHVEDVGESRILFRVLDVAGRDPVVGVTATSIAPLNHVRDRLVLVLLVATPALTAAVTLAAWLLAGAALRPVRRMGRRAETISLTEPRERLPLPPGDDEIAELGRTLNAMLERIETTVAHERAFIDDASHELRTPLAVLRGELELAIEEADLATVRIGIASALEETDRLIATGGEPAHARPRRRRPRQLAKRQSAILPMPPVKQSPAYPVVTTSPSRSPVPSRL